MISVCMVTYNGARYLRPQLDSILRQLGDDDELIISDEGSTDDTLSVIAGMDDKRIRVFHNAGPHGVNSNMSNALAHASGHVIFMSDQDDVWLPDKIRICLDEIGDADCLLHDCIITDGDLRDTGKSMFDTINAHPGFTHNILRNSFTGCCMCVRGAFIREILPIPPSNHFFYDQWVGLLAELTGKTRFINNRLILFRRHKTSLSSAASRSRLPLVKKFFNRVILIKSIFTLFVRIRLHHNKTI